MAHETSNQSRRDTENAHAMLLDQRPQTIRSGKIQCPLVEHHCRAEQGYAENLPRPHHPSHVRHPVKHVFSSNIEAKQHVLGGLDRKPTVGVKGSFGPTGRSGRVNDHQRIFSVGLFGFDFVALSLNLFMPPPVAIRSPWNRDSKSLENKHVLD